MVSALIDAAVDRWRTVLMMLGFILVMGSASYVLIPKEAAPDINIPLIYVSVTLEGISAEDAERLLVRPLEKELSSVDNVKEMRAESILGFASVTLEFEAGFDADTALNDVRAAVDLAKPELPEDADEPKVTELNFSTFPILNINLTGDVAERTLLRTARRLQDRLETINSVLEVKILGDREEMLEIVIDPRTLESYNLSPEDVFAFVQNNNILVAAGNLDTGNGRFAVKIPGLIETLRDIWDVPVKITDSKVVTLKEIASIRRTFKDRETTARVNEKPGLILAVSKRTGANIIETVEAVRAMVEEERAFWPSGMEVIYSQDNSSEIMTRLTDLQNNIMLAIFLVMIVLLVTLGARSAFLVSFAIPGAFLFGVLLLAVSGFTMNIVVLFALILSVGMLVDSAIVVAEYAARLVSQGVPPRLAYPQAAKRMAWPIIASTATTLVVFMPLLFWPGMVGQFMRYMPLTLIMTLAGSLLMALIFLPTLGIRLTPKSQRDRGTVHSFDEIPPEAMDQSEKPGAFSMAYAGLLDRLLHIPGRVAAVIFLIVVGLMVSFSMFGKGVEFFPKIDPEVSQVLIKARGNLSVDEKDALLKQVEARIRDMKELKVRSARAGALPRREITEDTVAIIGIEFVDWRDRPKADVVLEEIRKRTRDIPGIMIETKKQEKGPPVGKALQLEFTSNNPEVLEDTVAKVSEGLEQVGGFINIEDTRPIPQIEWEYKVDRELAAQYGIDINKIGQVVRMVTNGLIVNEYRPDDADDELDIVVRFPEEYRTLTQLQQLRVFSGGQQVPISQYVERIPKPSVGTIYKIEGKRVMELKADVEPGLVADKKVGELKAWLEENMEFDPRVNVAFGGEDEEQKEAGIFLATAFLIALFSMALIIVTQFNSLYDMVVIMSAVFFSTGGVLLGLLVTGQPFGIVMCGVGVISLAGIVVNNNIIFIDTYHILLKQGMSVREALIYTGMQRLRPILLTAGTTVLGLLPMVLGMNLNFVTREVTFGSPSSQWWTQLSTAIAGGLTFSTVLTLLFTPCLIMLWHRIAEWRNNMKSNNNLGSPPPVSS